MSEDRGGSVGEILVQVGAADPTDRGLRAAVRLARSAGPVRLLHVRPTGDPGPGPDGEALLERLRRDEPGVQVTWEVATGDDS